MRVLSNPPRLVYAPGRAVSKFRFAVHPISSSEAESSVAAKSATVPNMKPSTKNQSTAQGNRPVINWPAASPDPARVAVILFCPKGVNPPADFQEGIDRLADYTDDFILNGLRRWNHEPATKTLFRRKGEHVEVLGVVGKNGPDDYTDASVHKEAIAAAQSHYRIAPKTHIWWVLGFKGDPPLRFEGFKGGTSPEFGGWAVANFDSRAKQLRPGMSLGSPVLKDMALKGMIHELGHALRLPHLGPRSELKLGNTLMGPTHANFRRVTGRDEPQAYLSQAAAAMLSAHPVIRNRQLTRTSVPSVNLTEGELISEPGGKTVHLRGRIESNRQPLFAIAGNHDDSLPGQYWVRHYVSPVDQQGRFDIEVTQPQPSDGELRLCFIFINGEITGNGKQQSPAQTTNIPYRFDGGRWVLSETAG